MPGLDIYYAADVCYQARIKEQRPFWYKWLPRYRQYLRDEKAVFALDHSTSILVLSDTQQNLYHDTYQTPLSRFHLLPPGIQPFSPLPPKEKNPDEFILLMVGSGFKTKGLDRTLQALATLNNKARLWVIGQDNPTHFLKLAKKLHIADRVTFFGGRHDVARFFLAADLLVHPAYHENTGTVLLEAMQAGLPVLTLDVCGYAKYIKLANAGIVLPSPFKQEIFNQTLQQMLISPERETWKKKCERFYSNSKYL